MIKIKNGVVITGMKPEINLAISITNTVLDRHGYDCIVTEITGGRHSRHSLHPVGLAVDIRSKHIRVESKKIEILGDLREALGDKYDVILEGLGSVNEHYHIEYQPKHTL